jgi:hypothetical protein
MYWLGLYFGFLQSTHPSVTIQDMWHNAYTVLVDGKPPLGVNIWADDTNEYIYFTYQCSEHEIVIIPEFPLALVLSVFMVLTVFAGVFAKKRILRKPW